MLVCCIVSCYVNIDLSLTSNYMIHAMPLGCDVSWAFADVPSWVGKMLGNCKVPRSKSDMECNIKKQKLVLCISKESVD